MVQYIEKRGVVDTVECSTEIQ